MYRRVVIGRAEVLLVFVLLGTSGHARSFSVKRYYTGPSGVLDVLFGGSGALGDLQSEGNSPVRDAVDKKAMKNASGKSDEGGYYKTYGSDAEGEKGYDKGTYSNGEHGYKTLDTFHKKAGDNYGFEKHEAFGKTRVADKAGKRGESGTLASKVGRSDDHAGAGTELDAYYHEDDADSAAYTEGAESGGDTSGESSSYTDGSDSEHYTADDGDDDGDAARYTEGGSDSGNYGNSDGYNEHYSTGGGDEGSYGSHSSYTSGGDGDAFYGGEYY